MYRIINGRGTGKTLQLMLLAKENGATIACNNPSAMRQKAYDYGLTGINFISYSALFSGEIEDHEPIMIDEIEKEFEGKGYGDFKRAVADSVCELLESIQSKYNEICNSDIIEKTLQQGAEKANVIANAKVKKVFSNEIRVKSLPGLNEETRSCFGG